jgi:hypothetical protein
VRFLEQLFPTALLFISAAEVFECGTIANAVRIDFVILYKYYSSATISRIMVGEALRYSLMNSPESYLRIHFK